MMNHQITHKMAALNAVKGVKRRENIDQSQKQQEQNFNFINRVDPFRQSGFHVVFLFEYSKSVSVHRHLSAAGVQNRIACGDLPALFVFRSGWQLYYDTEIQKSH